MYSKRVVDYGDGWMPALALPAIVSTDHADFVDREEIERGRKELNDLAEAAGRDPASIVRSWPSAGPGQYRTRAAIDALAEAGADRATIWLRSDTCRAEHWKKWRSSPEEVLD